MKKKKVEKQYYRFNNLKDANEQWEIANNRINNYEREKMRNSELLTDFLKIVNATQECINYHTAELLLGSLITHCRYFLELSKNDYFDKSGDDDRKMFIKIKK